MPDLRRRLETGGPLVADGALGTVLAGRGHEGPPEAVNLREPEVLEEIARAYREAGAEILQTNTFGGSPIRLAAAGLEGKVREVNLAAAKAALRAAGDRAFVTGSVGPCGRYLEPYGDLPPGELMESVRAQVEVLAEAGVHAVSVETMMDVTEAVLAVRAAREAAPDRVVMATITVTPTSAGLRTPFGHGIAEAAERLARAGADVVGANCGVGVDAMLSAAGEFLAATSLPVLLRPNAGLPELRDGEPVWPEGPETFGAKAARLFDLGVTVVGGCCGTTPGHIRALRRAAEGRAPGPLPAAGGDEP